MDFASPINQRYIIVTVDDYSKWPEMFLVKTSPFIILRELFAQFGISKTLVMDNVPQFTDTEFTNFCQFVGILTYGQSSLSPQIEWSSRNFVDKIKRGCKTFQEERSMPKMVDRFLMTSFSSQHCYPKRLISSRGLPWQTHANTARRHVSHSGMIKWHSVSTHYSAKLSSSDEGNKVYIQWTPGVIISHLGYVTYSVRQVNCIVTSELVTTNGHQIR